MHCSTWHQVLSLHASKQAFTRTERELFSSEKLKQNDIFSHERRSLLETELNAELMRINGAQFTVQKFT